MTHSHPTAVAQAFDTIHEEMRRLQRENMELRRTANQKDAALELCKRERDDAQWHVSKLRGALARKFSKDGLDLGGIVEVVS